MGPLFCFEGEKPQGHTCPLAIAVNQQLAAWENGKVGMRQSDKAFDS
jgi:hypothetical protein